MQGSDYEFQKGEVNTRHDVTREERVNGRSIVPVQHSVPRLHSPVVLVLTVILW